MFEFIHTLAQIDATLTFAVRGIALIVMLAIIAFCLVCLVITKVHD